MTKVKIWTTIVGAGVVASITASVVFFPDLKIVLIAAAGLVSAVMAVIVGKK